MRDLAELSGLSKKIQSQKLNLENNPQSQKAIDNELQFEDQIEPHEIKNHIQKISDDGVNLETSVDKNIISAVAQNDADNNSINDSYEYTVKKMETLVHSRE